MPGLSIYSQNPRLRRIVIPEVRDVILLHPPPSRDSKRVRLRQVAHERRIFERHIRSAKVSIGQRSLCDRRKALPSNQRLLATHSAGKPKSVTSSQRVDLTKNTPPEHQNSLMIYRPNGIILNQQTIPTQIRARRRLKPAMRTRSPTHNRCSRRLRRKPHDRALPVMTVA